MSAERVMSKMILPRPQRTRRAMLLIGGAGGVETIHPNDLSPTASDCLPNSQQLPLLQERVLLGAIAGSPELLCWKWTSGCSKLLFGRPETARMGHIVLLFERLHCPQKNQEGCFDVARHKWVVFVLFFCSRMNQAPTTGFEEDVGARTTHHLMYPESARDLDDATSLVLIPFKTLDLQWIISALTTGTIKYTYIPVKSRIKANKDKVLIYNPAFFKYVDESWLEGHGRYPSTGFLGLLFALHICDQVNVFGFGADQHGNWHHYWEEQLLAGAFRETKVHDGDFEYNVTHLLADKHKIRMFEGR